MHAADTMEHVVLRVVQWCTDAWEGMRRAVYDNRFCAKTAITKDAAAIEMYSYGGLTLIASYLLGISAPRVDFTDTIDVDWKYLAFKVYHRGEFIIHIIPRSPNIEIVDARQIARSHAAIHADNSSVYLLNSNNVTDLFRRVSFDRRSGMTLDDVVKVLVAIRELSPASVDNLLWIMDATSEHTYKGTDVYAP
jgi:hypothetical protein